MVNGDGDGVGGDARVAASYNVQREMAMAMEMERNAATQKTHILRNHHRLVCWLAID